MALTQVSTAGVKDDAVTSGKIPANAVGSSEIAANAVTRAKITDGEVTNAKLDSNAVTTSKINNNAVTLAKLENGTSSNDGKFLRANNGAAPSFETVNTDLVSDTSPQLGGNLDTNSFEIDLDDGHAVRFGDGNDMQVYHSGSAGYLTNTTGNMIIQSNAFRVYNGNGSHDMIQANNGSAVNLYHNNSKKLETTSTGATVTGTIVADNAVGRNIIINGDMRVSQRGTSAAMSNHGSTINVCDRWVYNRNGVTADLSKSTDTPAGSGFKYSLKWQSTSAVGSIAGGNMLKFLQNIERQDIYRLGYGSSDGKKATISFWAKGSLAGKIGVVCRHDSRIFAASTSMTANTWQFHEIVVPIDTSSGFSGNDYDQGFNISIAWGAGGNSNNGSTGGIWLNFHNAYTSGLTATDQGAYLTTQGSTFQITGVQFELGEKATIFDHKHYSEEFLRCARYYQEQQGHSDMYMMAGKGQGSSSVDAGCNLVVPMRAQPSITLGGHRVFRNGNNQSSSTSAPTVINWDQAHSEHSAMLAINLPGHSGITNNEITNWCPHNALLILDAEM